MDHIHDIYDRIAKRCISLSTRCTINLINGLYGTDFPPDSEVTYNWTENYTDELKRTLADTIITINQLHSYHVEFQMTKDGDIVLRVLDYGFHHAMRGGGVDKIVFPEPSIVYLYDNKSFPDEYSIDIIFGTQGTFTYKVPVYKYLEKSLQELDDKKMIVLIPFQLLRLRRAIEKERTPENMEALKNLILHDILDSLNRNVKAGNIGNIEAIKIGRMIMSLYNHIYAGYDELEGVRMMAEEALIYDVDILEYKIKQLEENERILQEKSRILEEHNHELENSRRTLEENKRNLEENNRNLEENNRNLEENNRNLEENNRNLEENNRNLEENKRNLEEDNKNLLEINQILMTKMHVSKLALRGLSADEIADRLDLSPEEVMQILSEE